jgi:hypothetical protein
MEKPFSKSHRLSGSRKEQELARYIVVECHRGRDLADVLEDPYVQIRSDPTTIQRLMDHPEFVNSLGNDAVEQLRGYLANLTAG